VGFPLPSLTAEKTIAAILPAVIATVLVIIEVGWTGALSQAAINVITALQFACSLWFGAGVTYLFTEKDFQKKQKRFAISAYRRTKEIEANVQRLLRRFDNQGRSRANELEIAKEVLLSLKTTIASSKADWADVIGEEINTLEELLHLREDEDVPNPQLREKAETLLKSLPSTLEADAREILRSQERINFGAQLLRDELRALGYVEFEGFWEPEFEQDIFELEIGEELYVSIDDVDDRVAAFIAHTEDGRSVGVITNKGLGSSSYDEFTRIVMTAFNASSFVATYTEKGMLMEHEDGDRHYFKVRTSL
jgi:hypothetical protein